MMFRRKKSGGSPLGRCSLTPRAYYHTRAPIARIIFNIIIPGGTPSPLDTSRFASRYPPARSHPSVDSRPRSSRVFFREVNSLKNELNYAMIAPFCLL